MENSEPKIPSYFLCPISLQMMRDPVALPTGATYDRDSIEQWLRSSPRPPTCPLTNLPLPHSDLTPNHTLRRLIQSWCTLHTSLAVQRLPTPRPPLLPSQISLLLLQSPASSLAQLKKLASQTDRDRRCVKSAPGALAFLASLISAEDAIASDEAVSVLHSLHLSQRELAELLRENQDFLASLTRIAGRSSNYQARAHAVLLIKPLLAEMSAAQLIGLGEDFFEAVVGVLRDGICCQATKAALRALDAATPWGRNGAKAAKAGAVKVVVELLMDEHERKACEMMLAALDGLCGCAEGRRELVAHAAGLAAVGKKMGRVSGAATERAVRIVRSVCLGCGGAGKEVVEEMLEVGVVSKLVLLLGVECEERVRKMVKEILRKNFHVWRRSSCLSTRIRDLCYGYV